MLITVGMIFSLAASVSAQQVTLPGGGDEYGRESQSVKSVAIPPVPDSEAGSSVTESPEKAEAAKSTAAVNAVKNDIKNKKIPKPAAEKKIVPASTAVETAVSKAAPGVIVIKPSEEMNTAATASAKPSAAASAKPAGDAKPLVQNAPAVKLSQPKAETKKEAAPLIAGPKVGFAVTKKHTIIKGETLWDLSNEYYKDPFKWGKIYTGNLDKITDPDHIYPREEIDIPGMTEIVNPAPNPETVTDMDALVSEEGVASPYGKAGLTVNPGHIGAASARSLKSKDGLLSKETLEDIYASGLSEEMPEDLKEWADNIKIAPDSWAPDGVITGVITSESDVMSGSLTSSGEMVQIKSNKAGVLKSGDIVTAYMKGSIALDKDGKELGRELQKTGMLEVVGVEGSIVKARIIEAVTSVDSGQVIVK